MLVFVCDGITGETHGSELHLSCPGSGAVHRSAASQGCSGGAGDTGTDPDCSDQGRVGEEGPGWVLEPW